MLFRSFLLFLALFALVGCKGFLQNDIDETSRVSFSDLSDFESELYSGYLGLAQTELDEDDFLDSSYFLLRSRLLLAGKSVLPTAVEERNFTPENEKKVISRRAALVDLLDGGARSNHASLAARAQVMFDCWSQELEENYQPEDISVCEDALDATLAALEASLGKKPEPSQPKGSVDFTAYFPFNIHNKVTDKAALDNFAKDVIAKNPSFILITAHADSSGTLRYNYQLSKKRGEYIRDILVSGGVDSGIISVVAVGEKNLPVKTADGVKEPLNRRVFIQLHY